MIRPVQTNKLQGRIQNISLETVSPGSGTRHTASGVIVEVYDAEKLAVASLPEEIKLKVEANPGFTFGKIRLLNGDDYILPFYDPEDQLFSTYGNHILLEGRNAKVEYGGVNIETGYIILQRSFKEPTLNLQEASNILDIGQII